MSDITYSAPGKLFLIGEYAVLGRGWAIVSAIDRRVHVARRSEAKSYVTVGDETSLDLPLAVMRELELPATALEYFHSDISEMYRGGVKLGVGSSAASTVALTAAASHETETEVDEIFPHALRAHRALQGGRGSGGDVAASSFGGTIAMQLSSAEEAWPEADREDATELPVPDAAYREYEWGRIGQLGWPDDLRVEAFWIGEPASSASFVGAVTSELADGNDELRDLILRMAGTSRQALDYWQSGRTDRLLGAAGQYDEQMRQLGELTGVPVVTDVHQELSRRAGERALVTKPSGAGGGDVSIVMGHRDSDWDAFLADLPDACEPLHLTFGTPGVRRE